ncbi:aldehyde dehydrogenase family protein [Pacificimonas flava]|uniref:Aldehyde dehydrogenase family protein n=2 Tax=Pacificimonas TaxID=1960290 RepID=A0A219B9G6_9SPHN|nr:MULTISPECIES: aldehyde dehydrogenase family protein [Pacificimonas]MBZ6379866.1 aldehyde dehydrogenase family protein [Pacificimonas aurantium]OWV34793.1 aldehyde dehydrogenase family protein [Pacificimonas flava]
MRDYTKFYIGGEWVDPAAGATTLDVINPATEDAAGKIALGGKADVDKAVAAAKGAFKSFGRTSRQERVELLGAILGEYVKRQDDIAKAVTEEMGAPSWLSTSAQAAMGAAHFNTAMEILKGYSFEEQRGTTLLAKEPIGVCGFITPWNWPINQIACKVAPALATGCTVVLKPSEVAPFSAYLLTEVLHAAGVPAGVFNMVNGDGPTVGSAISSHPDVDMVSFTGSTRAGVAVAKDAADTVKRVHQELGGKSPNILLDDDGFGEAVSRGVSSVMMNSGQSCNAPTRMFVPKGRMDEAKQVAAQTAEGWAPGDPNGNSRMGPVVSDTQFDKIQDLIQKGIDEGAELVCGGTGRPDGLDKGYYVKPTVFANVSNDMTIAREEIFGPVVSILGYDSLDQAIEEGNDTVYGLAAYVQSTDLDKARDIARQLRAGQVNINGADVDFMAPFGGYKQSGNGREWGDHAFGEFLETKAILGFEAKQAAE